jgi:hypothetical protein
MHAEKSDTWQFLISLMVAGFLLTRLTYGFRVVCLVEWNLIKRCYIDMRKVLLGEKYETFRVAKGLFAVEVISVVLSCG